MLHYRKTKKIYNKITARPGCPFCEDLSKDRNIVKTTKNFYVVPNITFYDLWEFHDVVDHLLVIPKRHLPSLKDMSKAERAEMVDIVAGYESDGYSIYARGVGFIQRSQPHQHTHLIKVTNKRPKLGFFISKPYYLFKR